jgi:alkanesulfonate monooxygenase SsuD/methylene tetrahydromethanopterin reductase-like flavin-dependent oxidoreductase (luciferase family)
MPQEQHLHLAAALDGTGWHPAAAQEPDVSPGEEFTLDYWTELAQEAERGLLDFITIEDPLGRLSNSDPEATDPPGPLKRRLDSVLLATAMAPFTRNVGLVPTIVLTHAQPVFAAKALATLDFLTQGRAGWRPPLAPPRPIPIADLFLPEVQAGMAARFDRGADLVRVVRALWDGVEDERALRELAPGRFAPSAGSPAAREQPGSADDWIIVSHPSTAPRPPQGHPVIVALAHVTIPYRFAARAADVVSVTPHSAAEAEATVREIREYQATAGRSDEIVHIFADLVVFIDPRPGAAVARRERLDQALGRRYASDAEIVAGTPSEVADLMADWQRAGIAGFRLRPGTLPGDLRQITRHLVPELQRRGVFRTDYKGGTLREMLGLRPPRP